MGAITKKYTYDQLKSPEVVHQGRVGKFYHGKFYPKHKDYSAQKMSEKKIIAKELPKSASDTLKQDAPKHDGKEEPKKKDKGLNG
jgi:hypothetical protein